MRLATSGEAGLQYALRDQFDLILLDIMLPDISGIEICRKVREHSGVPIIMITARGEEADRVLGLEIGADDYLPKPFSPRELMARISAVLRRAKGQVGPGKTTVKADDLILDPGTHQAELSGRPLDLTPYEFQILLALAERPGRVLSRETILNKVWGYDYYGTARTIDNFINRLRQKIGDDSVRPQRIRTVRGVGYKFSE